MIAACLVSTVQARGDQDASSDTEAVESPGQYDNIDGPSEEQAYLNGSSLSNQTLLGNLRICL